MFVRPPPCRPPGPSSPLSFGLTTGPFFSPGVCISATWDRAQFFYKKSKQKNGKNNQKEKIIVLPPFLIFSLSGAVSFLFFFVQGRKNTVRGSASLLGLTHRPCR